MSSSPNSSSSSPAASGAPAAPADALTPLHDVVCHVDVMLGAAAMTVRECLNLRRDAIIKLTKAAGGDMQVVVNGIVVAYGEVVIVDESTAIRVTELVAPPSNEAGE
jgi:flagellar motor switch protein FliN/FliY